MKVIEVSESIIRQKFNRARYYEKAKSGEFQTRIKKNRHCEPPLPFEPNCTHSQLVYYYHNGNLMALVHQYVRPDGSIGAHGRPDPKYLVLRNITYKIKPK